MTEFFTQNKELIAQAAGFTAMLLTAVSFQFRKQRTIMLVMTASSFFWIAHYYLLGLYPAVAINTMNLLRNYIFGLREKKNLNSKLIPAAFVVIAVISVIMTWENTWDILPLIASITATIANWQKKTSKLKLISIPRYSLWVAYDLHGKAWAGLANDVLTIISICISLLMEKKSAKSSEKT